MRRQQEKLVIIVSASKTFGDFDDSIESLVNSSLEQLKAGKDLELKGHQNLSAKIDEISEYSVFKQQIQTTLIKTNVIKKDLVGIRESKLDMLKTKNSEGKAKVLTWKNSDFIIYQVNFLH